MKEIFLLASSVSTPLALSGLFAIIFFYLIKQVLSKNIFPVLTGKFSSDIIKLIIHYIFIISFIAMVLGFAGYIAPLLNDKGSLVNENNININKEISKKKTEAPEERAKDIVTSYFNLNNIDIHKVIWNNFSSSGAEGFYIYYNNLERGFIDVFTVHLDKIENIFHEFVYPDEVVKEIAHINIEDKSYFIYATQAGSGGYLSIYIYKYDGIGKLILVYKEEGLFSGDLSIKNNTVYFHDSTKKYYLKYNNGNFERKIYTQRLSYEFGSSSHVLSLYFNNDDTLRVNYDKREVFFKKDNEKEMTSKETFAIEIDEQVFIDNNIIDAPSQAIRLFADGCWNFQEGFFPTLTPIRKGKGYISINYNYKMWYQINFIIE